MTARRARCSTSRARSRSSTAATSTTSPSSFGSWRRIRWRRQCASYAPRLVRLLWGGRYADMVWRKYQPIASLLLRTRADMMVKPGHPHVTSEGFVKIPYTTDWRQVSLMRECEGGIQWSKGGLIVRCRRWRCRTLRWWSSWPTCAQSLATCHPCSAARRT